MEGWVGPDHGVPISLLGLFQVQGDAGSDFICKEAPSCSQESVCLGSGGEGNGMRETEWEAAVSPGER